MLNQALCVLPIFAEKIEVLCGKYSQLSWLLIGFSVPTSARVSFPSLWLSSAHAHLNGVAVIPQRGRGERRKVRIAFVPREQRAPREDAAPPTLNACGIGGLETLPRDRERQTGAEEMELDRRRRREGSERETGGERWGRRGPREETRQVSVMMTTNKN
jgi:hypothetical protein